MLAASADRALPSVASLHRARFALLEAARSAPASAPLELLLEPFFSSLRAAQAARPPVPPPALHALHTAILLLALRPAAAEPDAPPVVVARDASAYLLDRLLAVRGLAWGRALLQPPATSARATLAFAARVLDERAPAESEAEALLALSQCAWHDAARHAAGEEDACLAALSALLARAHALSWPRVYAALAHFASMLAREAPFYAALPYLAAALCSDRRSRTLASPVLPLFAFHEAPHPAALLVCFARLYALPLQPDEEVADDAADPLALVRGLGAATSDRRRDARAAIIEELVAADGAPLALVYRAASAEAAALHQAALRPGDSAAVRAHVPRLPLLHALFRLARAAAQAAERDTGVRADAYIALARVVTEELTALASLALRPPERAAAMQAEAGLYAGASVSPSADPRPPTHAVCQRRCVRRRLR